MSRQQKKNDNRTFRRGAVLGAIIGAITALWNSPQSGKITRQQISRLFRRVRGESVEESLDYGKMIAQQNRADRADDAKRRS